MLISIKQITGAADNDISDVYSDVSDTSYMSALDNSPQSIQYDYSNGSPVDKSKFIVVHYNINSITAESRIDTLTDVCTTLNISVLLLTETKLDSTIPNNILTIPGYHLPIRHDRPINGRYGGGCLLYISEKLTFRHQTMKQSQHFEHLWVDICSESKSITINCLYRPPNETAADHDLFISTSESILEQLSNHDADVKIVSGDLNFGNCYSTEPILQFKPLDNAASQVFSSFGFTQLIDIPTRFTENTISLIDLVFVQSQDLIDEYGTLPQIADHDGTLLCLNIKQKVKKPSNKTIYDYNNMDTDGLIQYIKTYNFENSIFNLPLSEQAQQFTNILQDAFKSFVPTKTICIRPNSIPWCNTYTRLLLRKKNRNYKIYKKSLNIYNKASSNDNYNEEHLTVLLNKKN